MAALLEKLRGSKLGQSKLGKLVADEERQEKVKRGVFSRIWGFVKRLWLRCWKAAIIVVLVVCVCIPMRYVNNAIGYVPALVMVLGIGLSYLYLFLLERSLKFEEASRAGECIRGTNMDFVLRLTNKGILLFPRIEVVFHQSDLFGHNMREETCDITLAPKAKRDFTFTMRFDHVGEYQAGLKRVVLHDIIGLFSKVYENEELQTINVLPRVYSVHDIAFDAEAPTNTTAAIKTILNEGIDYSQVREYRWGDPIKAIHWKLSARFPEYMTRIYETNTNPGLTTLIDLRTNDGLTAAEQMEVFDGVIEGALSVHAFALSQGLDSELTYVNEYGEERRCPARLQNDALHEITSMLREDTTPYKGQAIEVLRRELNSPNGQSNIAVCTSTLENGLLDLLILIKQRRRNPILFFCFPEDFTHEQRKELLEPLRRLDGTGVMHFAYSSMAELSERGH